MSWGRTQYLSSKRGAGFGVGGLSHIYNNRYGQLTPRTSINSTMSTNPITVLLSYLEGSRQAIERSMSTANPVEYEKLNAQLQLLQSIVEFAKQLE